MLLPAFLIIIGFVTLVWGADKFVLGSTSIARNLGMPPLLIGLTLVGLGTSAPEILVSGVAALQGNPGLSIGNAIGSNIANISLILGLTALMFPLRVHSDTLKREFPILLAITLFTALLLMDGYLGKLDGALLLLGLATMIYWMTRLGRKTRRKDPIKAEYADEIPDSMPMKKSVTWFLVGLLVLLAGSKVLVIGAIDIATQLGVSDLVIGLTIVAIGTSLPELAASIVSAIKKEHEIAIGNVIGSNMYNLLAVLSLPGLIHPSVLDPSVLGRDFPVMTGLTIALFAMAYGFSGDGKINRFEGATLLCAFFGYQLLIYTSI